MCKECGSLTRPAPHPGPRCTTCHRQFKSGQKQRSHDKYVQDKYGLAPGEYELLYVFQGGRCFICRRATGKVRKLAVDHDHACCPELPACGECVRGLCCKTCNRLLGHLRDDPEAFERAARYLRFWPMREMREANATG